MAVEVLEEALQKALLLEVLGIPPWCPQHKVMMEETIQLVLLQTMVAAVVALEIKEKVSLGIIAEVEMVELVYPLT